MSETTDYRFIRTEERDGVIVVQFKEGRLLDETLIRDIGKELISLAESDEPKLVLTFSNVEFLASAMLGKLITLQRRVQQNNGALGFCSIPADTYEVFRISKLDNYFNIFPDEETAIKAITGSARTS
jgi:anti-sigma B factor antagonist